MAEPSQASLVLADLVDRIDRGEDLERVMAQAAGDRELTDLVRLARALAEHAPTRPRPAFRAALQVKLQDAVDAAPPRRRWRTRLLMRLAGALAAIVLLVASTVAVSAASLPGDTLYGMKRFGESTRLALTLGAPARARLQLDYASRRLAEIRGLVDRGLPVPASVIDALVESHGSAQQLAAAAGDQQLQSDAESRARDAQAVLSTLPDLRLLTDDQTLDDALRRLAASAADRSGQNAPATAPGAGPTPGAARAPVAVALPSGTPTATPSAASSARPTESGAPVATASATTVAAPTQTPRSPIDTPVVATALPPTPAPPSATAEASRPPGTAAGNPDARATELAGEATEAARPTDTPRRRPPHSLGPTPPGGQAGAMPPYPPPDRPRPGA